MEFFQFFSRWWMVVYRHQESSFICQILSLNWNFYTWFLHMYESCRQSFEMYERVWALEGHGELKQEALVNSGNSLCDWASLLASISEENGGGIAAAAERYNEADKR